MQEHPSTWVARFAPLISHGGEVLDLACGGGRHARLLAQMGHRVLAADRDPQALQRAAGAGIVTQQVDLETGPDGFHWPFEAERFAGIVVTNYLHRPLLPHLVAGLSNGGVLIYETFAQGNEQFGKPSNPLFLLRRRELLDVASFAGIHVLAYEEGYIDMPKPAIIQRICAINSAPDGDAAVWRLP